MKVHFMVEGKDASTAEVDIDLPFIPRIGETIDPECLWCNDQVYKTHPKKVDYPFGKIVDVAYYADGGVGKGCHNPIIPYVYVEDACKEVK